MREARESLPGTSFQLVCTCAEHFTQVHCAVSSCYYHLTEDTRLRESGVRHQGRSHKTDEQGCKQTVVCEPGRKAREDTNPDTLPAPPEL